MVRHWRPSQAATGAGTMERSQDALVEVIRAIIGPSGSFPVSRERILALLKKADNDPNKAVDLYFQDEAINGAEFKMNDVEGSDEEDNDDMAWAETPALPRKAVKIDTAPEWTPQAAELSGLLGGDVKREVILELMRRTNNDLQKAVEIYFSENGVADAESDDSSDEEVADEAGAAAKIPLPSTPTKSAESNGTGAPPSPSGATLTVTPPSLPSATPQTPSPSSGELPQTPSALKAIEAHQLSPLTPPTATSPEPIGENEAAVIAAAEKTEDDEDALNGPGTYEVVMVNSNFRWQIGNVFGRAVVQQVQAGGPAALAGIQKADVLLSFRETVLNEENCAAVVQQLSKEVRSAAAAVVLAAVWICYCH
ncbi:hypothetical protein BBJ28_00017418 [Nothophytophthora sp. Chile5]|nr:hypothetical protein BBJ28_00017418 [Nothophytophthora sp. Chile5]